MTKTVLTRECKFAIHIPTRSYDIPDFHIVKELLTYDDGTTERKLRLVKDYQRTFYVTAPHARNHEQKKEWEAKELLLERTCTQSKLRDEIAIALERSWSKDSIRKLNRSPYIYGADISSTALIKQMYQTKYPTAKTQYTVAAFDIETDVLHGTESVIMATIAMEDRVFTAVIKNFVSGFSSIQERFSALSKRYIGAYLDKHQMKMELYIAEDVVDLIRAVFAKAHEWKPDFLAIWNMDFDIPKVLKVLEDNGADPKDILCDPSVPEALRICKYQQGSKKKVTASGRVIPISPAMQWHTLICTSSFYVIDAMCSYKYIRLAKQEESSYALDAILNKELGIRKLKFTQADEYHGLKWHQFMQSEYQLEYMVYNVFDCISMLELDDHTKDLAFTLPTGAGISDFCDFKSQPKRIADAFYFFIEKQGWILGTVGAMEDTIVEEIEEDIVEDTDDEDDDANATTLSLAGWVN